MLSSWLPFLIYGVFAAAVPTSMIVASFKFAQRPGSWQSSNLTDRHTAKGLTAGNAIDRIVDYTVSLGGPSSAKPSGTTRIMPSSPPGNFRVWISRPCCTKSRWFTRKFT